MYISRMNETLLEIERYAVSGTNIVDVGMFVALSASYPTWTWLL